MKKLAIIFSVIIVAAGCKVDKIGRANEILRAQVANDVTVDIDRSTEKLFETPGRYYVCGTGTVNQPGITNHHVERFIITVDAEANNGLAFFDGSDDEKIKSDFQKSWDSRCEK